MVEKTYARILAEKFRRVKLFNVCIDVVMKEVKRVLGRMIGWKKMEIVWPLEYRRSGYAWCIKRAEGGGGTFC